MYAYRRAERKGSSRKYACTILVNKKSCFVGEYIQLSKSDIFARCFGDYIIGRANVLRFEARSSAVGNIEADIIGEKIAIVTTCADVARCANHCACCRQRIWGVARLVIECVYLVAYACCDLPSKIARAIGGDDLARGSIYQNIKLSIACHRARSRNHNGVGTAKRARSGTTATRARYIIGQKIVVETACRGSADQIYRLPDECRRQRRGRVGRIIIERVNAIIARWYCRKNTRCIFGYDIARHIYQDIILRIGRICARTAYAEIALRIEAIMV